MINFKNHVQRTNLENHEMKNPYKVKLISDEQILFIVEKHTLSHLQRKRPLENRNSSTIMLNERS